MTAGVQAVMPLAMLGALHYDRITDLAWSTDGRFLAASSYDGFCRWDLSLGQGNGSCAHQSCTPSGHAMASPAAPMVAADLI